MPIYEYFCKKCDVQVELLQSIKAKTRIRCPECNQWIKRIMSLVGSVDGGLTPKFF